MSERIHLTPRQIQLLAPQVAYVTRLREQAVRLQELLESANAQLIRECELAYPAWTQGCRFIASEGCIELPQTAPITEVDADFTGLIQSDNGEGPE